MRSELDMPVVPRTEVALPLVPRTADHLVDTWSGGGTVPRWRIRRGET